MRRLAVFVAIVAIAGGSARILAAGPATVKGEVVDITCYTKDGANATGAGHADCATSCAKRGSPMGILADGQVYQITGTYAKDKNKKLLDYVAKNVQAKGTVTEKDGKKMIDVEAMELTK
jgi:hypothetical protein